MTAFTDLPLTERTAVLRRELRKAIKNGRLSMWPDGATVSVRKDTGSMYQNITIAVTAPDGWALLPGDGGLTPAARELGTFLADKWLSFYTGHAWGDVTINDRGAGSVPKAGWTPGQD